MAFDEDESTRFTRRALIFGGAGAFGFVGLGARLYKLQVLEASKYRGLSEDNQFNFRLLVPSRGKILDRKGELLATNIENYRLLLMPDQVTDLDGLLKRLKTLVSMSDAREQDIRKAYGRRDRFAPIRIMDNMNWDDFAKVNLWLPDLPGIRPEVGDVRFYPSGPQFAHLIGYVGRVPADVDATSEPLLRHPGFRIGRTALERSHELDLRGKAGALKIEVNALGRVVRELPDKRTIAVPGKNIQLTLDIGIQNLASKVLEGQSGAACLLDLKAGEVRALVSSPSYDPNKFAKGISSADYRELLGDEFKPLFSKATGGTYPPASCFKPVVAMAAFDAGLINPNERITCKGKIKLGGREFHCWRHRGHGRLDLNAAIGTSCDIYFYELAKRLGIDRLHDAAVKFGFGKQFDLGLGTEKAGLVPNQAWKRARLDLPWAQGETLIAGIGQGYLAATPLQLAVMAGRIATGRAIEPHLIARSGTGTPMEFSDEAFAIAHKGMASVVGAPWGTSFTPKGIDGKGMEWAGKSGTGQVRRISRAEREDRVRKNRELPWKLRDHALFVAFAPLVNPRFAVSVLVEHGGEVGGGGSRVAAPKAREILRYALAQDQQKLAKSGEPA
jgi:penicillin-binding protein 2